MLLKEHLKAAISDSGMYVKEIAARSGVNKRTIDKWIEGDKETVPNVNDLYEVCQVLGVTVEWLFTGTELRLNDNFYGLLKEKYDKTEKKRPKEFENACNIIEKIHKGLRGRYEIVKPINISEAGIILLVEDSNLKTKRALKMPRPIPESIEYISKNILDQIKYLCELNHQNIISVYYAEELIYDDVSYPYYVMEYIEDAEDGYDYLVSKNPGFIELISFLHQWVSGLSKLHDNGIIHGDVKLENVLVSQKQDLLVKVSDLGSARQLKDDGTNDMAFTRPYAHPELLNSLGKNIFRILDMKKYRDGLINEYQRNYLTLLAVRLLDGENRIRETFMNIPHENMRQFRYEKLDDVLLDLKKANGEYSIGEIIPELNKHSQKTIQASLSGINTFTDRVSRLLNNKLVSRLANITQLGLMVYIYPTAVHTRLEHVLGTMLNVAGYIDALWHDPINPFFKQVIAEKDIKKLLVASLLHDIGQYPLAHDFEEADNKLFSHAENNIRLLTEPKIRKNLDQLLYKDWGLSVSDILPILDKDAENKTSKDEFLSSIIDGPIDADKLDYLLRDANNLNIPYGKAIDYAKIIRSLTVVFQQNKDGMVPMLGIHEKGKIAAEGIAFARYAMFGAVYWHHTVRSFKAMLHRAVWEALPDTGDKRSAEYRNIKEDIFKEINDQVMSEAQPWLMEVNSSNLKYTGNMNPYDFKIISYFYGRTTPTGQRLLEMICERNLYKRLQIISENSQRNLWNRIMDRKKDGDLNRWVLFQKTFEEMLLNELMSITINERTVTALSIEHTDKIKLLVKQKNPLFLIDVPPPRGGNRYPLQYLHETRFTNTAQLNAGNAMQSEVSDIWKSITNGFTASIGKARIFCHPDIIDTVSAFFTRDKIDRAIEGAWHYTI